MSLEIWRPVPGYEKKYEISSLGRVKTLERTRLISGVHRRYKEKIMKPAPNGNGRLGVGLYQDGKRKTFDIHVLVATAFLPNPYDSNLWVLHKNGDHLDNRVENLYWGTASENSYDAVMHGTHHKARRVKCSRGHLLEVPNLVPSHLKKGMRDCLSCSRTQSRYTQAKRKGTPFDPDLFCQMADEYYKEILPEGIDNDLPQP